MFFLELGSPGSKLLPKKCDTAGNHQFSEWTRVSSGGEENQTQATFLNPAGVSVTDEQQLLNQRSLSCALCHARGAEPQVPSSRSALLVFDLFASSAVAVAWLISVLAKETQSKMKHQVLGATENCQGLSLGTVC